MTATMLRDARLLGADARQDLLIVDGRIALIGPGLDESPAGAEQVPLDGRTVVPGLWDEHVHFTQWTVRQARLDLGGTTGPGDVLDRVRSALRERAAGSADILTGYGMRDGTWTQPPSLRALDDLAGDAPVVLISGDLHCAWVSSAAARRLHVDVDESGLVREGPWIAALGRLREQSPVTDEMFRRAASEAARRGVVGIVDFENEDNAALWPARVDSGVDALRVRASVWPDRLDEAIDRGLRTGDVLDARGLVTMGPLKVVVDGSLNTRTALCWDPYPGLDPQAPDACGVSSVPPAALRGLLERARAHGIGAAVHAIGDRANAEVLDVFEALGMPGSIEHAQLLSDDDFARLAALGLIASVQPEHAMDDRDVADRHWAGRTGRAFAYRSLLDAGATLRFGSDAPVAPLDPWEGIAASVTRSRDGREPWHPEQRVAIETALAASMSGRLRPRQGDPADLAILDADPLDAAPDVLRALPVAGTLVGGRWTWRGLEA